MNTILEWMHSLGVLIKGRFSHLQKRFVIYVKSSFNVAKNFCDNIFVSVIFDQSYDVFCIVTVFTSPWLC